MYHVAQLQKSIQIWCNCSKFAAAESHGQECISYEYLLLLLLKPWLEVGVIILLENNSPSCSYMPDSPSKDNDGNGEKHDQHIDSSLSTECIDVASLCDPWNYTVQEPKSDDILSRVSVASRILV